MYFLLFDTNPSLFVSVTLGDMGSSRRSRSRSRDRDRSDRHRGSDRDRSERDRDRGDDRRDRDRDDRRRERRDRDREREKSLLCFLSKIIFGPKKLSSRFFSFLLKSEKENESNRSEIRGKSAVAIR